MSQCAFTMVTNSMAKPRLIVTTSWDDNSGLNLKLASLLSKYEIPGTFYICATNDDQGRTLEESGYEEISRMGFEIGSHGSTHCDLRRARNLPYELSTSKAKLGSLLGREITCFCYPKNLYDNRVSNAVKRAGYSYARSAHCSIPSVPTDPFRCPVTLHASNRSPLQAGKLILMLRSHPLDILDWRRRALSAFYRMLKSGGIWHLYGHSWEIERHGYWSSLREVLSEISHRKDALYMSNSNAWRSYIMGAR